MTMVSMDLHALVQWRSQYCTSLSSSDTTNGTWCCSFHRLGHRSFPAKRNEEVSLFDDVNSQFCWRIFINEFSACVISISFINVKEIFTHTRSQVSATFKKPFPRPLLIFLCCSFSLLPPVFVLSTFNSFPLLFLLISFHISYAHLTRDSPMHLM